MSPLRPVVIKTRRGLLAGTLVAAVAFPVATYIAGSRVSNNCASINRVVDAGSKILDPNTQLQYALAHHLITEAQYRDQIRRAQTLRPLTQHYLDVWRSGACR